MLSHNETRKMAIKSRSNVKSKHEVQAYQYLKKKLYPYRYFIKKSYRYHDGISLPVPEEVKKSKPKSPVRKTEASHNNVLLPQIRRRSHLSKAQIRNTGLMASLQPHIPVPVKNKEFEKSKQED
jgi:hypothetical protein